MLGECVLDQTRTENWTRVKGKERKSERHAIRSCAVEMERNSSEGTIRRKEVTWKWPRRGSKRKKKKKKKKRKNKGRNGVSPFMSRSAEIVGFIERKTERKRERETSP